MNRPVRKSKRKGASKGRRNPGPRATVSAWTREIGQLSEWLPTLQSGETATREITTRLVREHSLALAGIWRLEADGSLAQTKAVKCASSPLPRDLRRLKPDDSLIGRTARNRSPPFLSGNGDFAEDSLLRWSLKHRLKFTAAFPLLYGKRLLGVLTLAGRKKPTESDLALYRLYSRLAAVALHDGQAFREVQGDLRKSSFLVEASKALSSTLDLSELLGKILEVAKSQVGAERGTIYLVDRKGNEIWSLIAHGLKQEEIRLPLGSGIAGHVAETGEILNIPDVYAHPRFNPELDKKFGFRTTNLLCLPIRNKSGTIIAALQLLNKKGSVFTDEDVDFLSTLSGHIGLALENAQLHQDLLEKQRMQQELDVAQGIQRGLLPETVPAYDGFDIAVLNEPYLTVGGDYYDFLSLGPQTLLIIVADVQGKGVSSALVMSNLQATLRTLINHLHSLERIAESVNRMILEHTRGERYLSMFLGMIDTGRKKIHYINCGHVPPLLVREGTDPLALSEGGTVIGLFEDTRYERGQQALQTGDLLLLCTDGITESMNAEEEEYGSDRLVRMARQSRTEEAQQIVDRISADVGEFSRHGTLHDDKVMMVIKVV